MEIWDGYLDDGTLAGVDLVRGEPIPKGLHHIVCEILVRHEDGDYLIMKRDLRKPNHPGEYEASAGGSALKGEQPLPCAKRELQEETGIFSENMELIGKNINHDTIYYEYLCVTDCDKEKITLQEGETIAYHWIPENEFIAFLNSDKAIASQVRRFGEYYRKQGWIH